MKSTIVAFLFLIALSGCSESKVLSVPDSTSDSLIVRTGTSFGMCVGYCQKDYTFNGTSGTLIQNAPRTQAQYPTKTCQTTISEADWNAIKAAANFKTFSKQPERIGCPDCADAGAEYIELQAGDQTYRVTFEYNKTIPGFESLVDALRKQRTGFPVCN